MVSEKIIGSGSQSTIFLAATMGNDTRQLACKTIKTKSLDRQVAENVASELGLLKQIHHVSPALDDSWKNDMKA